ncbi:hypothetical protein [Bdellovibrio svalbardensis]|uniref:Outer membrane protein beta-barrel domain-containing protein n=1 Tax=Bdellovibrio svalbardensis TaxID=2972972 RepID=A0ABT6DPA6_9BACT|nr:hypothetical protein [Bdellovibrio svalbardensis]MDG0817666.1 hypothetical protein [Bdellovibrio svalbardensis]
MKKARSLLALIGLFIFCIMPQSAVADEVYPGEEMFLFQLGYFLPSFDTKLRVDNANGTIGDEVNLEDDLGFKHETTTIMGNATWRMSPRNRLSLGYFGFHRGSDHVLNKDITIGDNTYAAGATVSSAIDFTVIPISYSFSFIKTDEWEFAGTFGLQWSTITFDANGSATVGGAGGAAHARADAVAPLPLIGLDLTYYIFPEWSVGGNIGVFSYKVAASNMDFQGNIATANVNTDWWFSNYVGAGLAVNWFSFDVDVEGAKWKGSFNYQYLGPQIYLTGRF